MTKMISIGGFWLLVIVVVLNADDTIAITKSIASFLAAGYVSGYSIGGSSLHL